MRPPPIGFALTPPRRHKRCAVARVRRAREVRQLRPGRWRAAEEEMARALRAANVARDILDLISTVARNCSTR
eukprot:4904055-Pyramimonas_sp.AAC.1